MVILIFKKRGAVNVLIYLVCFFISTGVFSSTKKVVGPSEDAQFYYYEVRPNTKKNFTIQAIKCVPEKNELLVEKFYSKKKVEENKIVDVISVIVRAGDCKLSPFSSVWSEKLNIPKSSSYTHIYITTLSDNIMVLNN